MPEPLKVITDSNQDSDDELLSTVAEIAERTARIESTLTALLTAFRTGGIKGLRAAASSWSPHG